MQHIAGQIASLNKPIFSTPRVVRLQPQTAAPHLAAVWCNALEGFIAHAAPLLALGVIGFAALPLLTPVLAVFSAPLTRMALTCLATHGTLHHVRRRQIAASMVMSGVFMILMTAGQVGMGVALRAGGLNLNFADQATTTWASAAQTVVMRSVNAISGADSPLQQWLPPLRNHAFLELLGQPNAPYDNPFHEYIRYTSADIATINSQAKLHQINRVDRQLIFISSVVTLIVVETLFAFRSLLCVKPSHLFWLSVSRFGVIAGHLWCLRLVIVGLKAILIFTPMAIVGRYSYLAHDLDWGWFGSPLQGYTWVICLALINAIISTFEAVYVAQVYRALLESDKCERNSQQSELIFTRLRPDSVPQALERQ